MNAIGQKLPNGSTVIDETCKCGHSVTEHENEHGACAACSTCPRFTWKCFVTDADEEKK